LSGAWGGDHDDKTVGFGGIRRIDAGVLSGGGAGFGRNRGLHGTLRAAIMPNRAHQQRRVSVAMREPLQRVCQQKEESVTLIPLAGAADDFCNVTASRQGI